MSRYYAVRIVDGRHLVGITTDGIDWIALPRAAFDTPRRAIDYAEMRQQEVSPLRSGDEVAVPVTVFSPSSPEPSGLTSAGRGVHSGTPRPTRNLPGSRVGK